MTSWPNWILEAISLFSFDARQELFRRWANLKSPASIQSEWAKKAIAIQESIYENG